MKHNKGCTGAALGAAVLVLVAGCGGGSSTPSAAKSSAGPNVTIADGWTEQTFPGVTGTFSIATNDGLQYGPLTIIQDDKALEKVFPNASVKYVQLNSTPQIRDSLVSGQIVAGTCSQPPFLQARDAGVDWRILTTVAHTQAILFTHKGGPSSVAQLVDTSGKIAGGPGTAYDYALQIALSKAGKKTDALKNKLTQLSHGDAYAAFKGNQVIADFAPAQFALEHEQAGDQKILDTTQAYGGPLSTGICVLKSASTKHATFTQGYYNVIQDCLQWMSTHATESNQQLSDSTKGTISPDLVAKLISTNLLTFTSSDPSAKVFAQAMSSVGAIKNKYDSTSDLYLYPDKVKGIS